jgi:putative glutamine amidotransferase
MFKNKHIFLTTGPSVFSNEIKQMVQKAFNAIPIYVNNDKEEDLEYLAEQADALVLAGGSDVFRGTLGQPIIHNEGLSKFDILRDKREINLIEKFVEQNKPILAICRGFQLICAHYGFCLIPDIGGQIAHSLGEIKLNLENGEFCHYVECFPEYRQNYFHGKMGVNSYHHQGIYVGKEINKNTTLSRAGINIVACADTSLNKDHNYKIAEIVESEEKKIVGMQFHPEADWEYGNLASIAVINRFKEML